MSRVLITLQAKLRRHGGPLTLLAALYAGLMAMTWRRWADPLIDSGRELYVPWRLSEGDGLYGDIAHLFGPLSHYYHAFLFNLFGVSYTVIVLSNALWLGLLTLLVYRLLARGISRYAGMVGAGLLLCISGFGNTIDVGNYNFMSPYCHEIVHGISLSILMFALLGEVSSHCRKVKLFGAGACFGAVLFTKPEVVLAAAVGLGVMLAARIWSSLHTQCRISALKEVGMVVIGAALTVVLASVAFHRGVPELPLYYAIAAPWLAVTNPAMTSSPFYHAGAGLDMPAANVVAMLRETFRVLLWLSALLVLGRVLAVSRHRRWVRLVCPVAVAALLLCIPLIDIYTIGRALPLLGVGALVVLLCKWQRERVDSGVGYRSLALIGFALFGLILLIKMGLASRLHHYGVFLGMPTLVVCGSLVVGVLPECLPGSRGEQCYRRAVMGLAIALFALPFVATTHSQVSQATIPLGEGGDRLYAGVDELSRGRTAALEQTRVWIEEHVPSGAPLIVMPEGVILNYLTRHANPTRFLNLNPPELALAGEATVLAALIETAPEWIVIVNRDVAEFGVLPFGGSPEYGGMLNDYVTATCEPVWQSSVATPSERLFPTCQVWQRRALRPAVVTLP
jgi:hypothetical protein